MVNSILTVEEEDDKKFLKKMFFEAFNRMKKENRLRSAGGFSVFFILN
jgi:hypothetical protein